MNYPNSYLQQKIYCLLLICFPAKHPFLKLVHLTWGMVKLWIKGAHEWKKSRQAQDAFLFLCNNLSFFLAIFLSLQPRITDVWWSLFSTIFQTFRPIWQIGWINLGYFWSHFGTVSPLFMNFTIQVFSAFHA